jgi:ElaB/YqjD/DUF883 family membrane-anchored ribosome-binding protein
MLHRRRNHRGKSTTSIEEEVSKIKEDLAALGNALGESASAETAAALQSLRQRFDRVAENASAMTGSAIERTGKTITDNPFIAIASAFGVGIVLSAMLLRR